MGRTRRYIPKPPPSPRPPEAARVLADLELVETAGLRASVELRGFDEHDLADMLADAIERVYTIHDAAEKRLRDAVPTGAQS
jgi:hypothetical protein